MSGVLLHRVAVGALALGAIVCCAARAAADDIAVFTSGAPAAVQQMLAPQFETATGHRVAITAATLSDILKRRVCARARRSTS